MTDAPFPTSRPRPTWIVLTLRIGLVVIAGSLFAVAAPVTSVVYGVPVPLSLLVAAVLSTTAGIAPWAPRTAAVALLAALAALGLLTAGSSAGPWPVSATGIIGLSVLLVVLGIRTTWRPTATVWAAATVVPLVLVAVSPRGWGQADVWAASSVVSAGDTGTPVRVLMLTTFDIDDYVLDALRAGASGLPLKDASADELVGGRPDRGGR